MPPLSRVRELLHQSIVDLFAAYDVTVSVCHDAEGDSAPDPASGPDSGPHNEYAAVIGFTGDALRGTLLLVPAAAVVKSAGAQPTAAGQRDWVGELANQMLGRLKMRLLRFQVDLSITTPLVVRGSYLAPVATSDSCPFLLHYRAPAGDVKVWIDVDLAHDLQLDEEHGEGVMAEGDLMLF